MNPAYKIVWTRLLQFGVPAAVAWSFWQKLCGRPLKFRIWDTALFCGVLSANLISVLVGPARYILPRVITCLPPGKALGRAVALTFDDGPDPETTPLLLDALREAGARATFFVLAPNVAWYPALARRIVEEGHSIGLHGARHEAVALWRSALIEQELRTALQAIVGVVPEPSLYRPPYGFKSASVQRAADRMGMQLTTWSLNPKDYHEIGANEITRRVLRAIKPGSIVLLHDSRPATAEALPELLRRLRGREFRCVRL